jgi:hypothetical protein
VACDDGSGCWVAGWVRGRPVVWAIEIAAEGQVTVRQPTVLDGTPPSGADPNAQVAVVGNAPVVLTGAAVPTLQVGCPDGWRSLAAPSGTATTLLGAASGLYAITGTGLHRLDPQRC